MRFVLALLLDMFPRSFRARVGSDWITLTEELLTEARAQGRWTLARAWMGLVLDTAKAAPVAHARQAWAMMAKPSDTSEVQVQANGTLALARKWSKPFEVKMTQVLSEYWFFFFLGTQVAMTMLVAEKDASLKVVLLSWPALMVFLVCVGWHKEIKAWWLRLNKPVVAPVLFTATGFAGVLLITVMVMLNWMNSNLVKNMVDFPVWRKGMNLPEWKDDGSLVPNTSFDAQGALLPERKATWCLNALTRLDVVTSMMKSPGQEGRVIQAILIRVTQDQLAGFGCLSDAQLLAMADDVAMAVKDNMAPSASVAQPWRRLPLFNTLLAGDAIAWPNTLMTSFRFCGWAGFQEWGPKADPQALWEYCRAKYDDRNEAYDAALQAPEGTGLKRAWSWVGLHTFGYVSLDNARRAADQIHTITLAQAQVIREDLRKHRPVGATP